jgi:glycosyltransferase involved in cell wall biosynthesis
MSKIKVVFLARLFEPHIGGVELHLKKLSEQLAKENYEITLVVEQDDPGEALAETIDCVKVLRIPLPNQQTNKLAIWSWVIKHYKIFFNADIIHIHDVFFWIFPLFPFLKFANKNIFMTFHGHEGNGNPNSKQVFWHQVAAKLSKSNICIGGFHKKWYGVTPTITTYGAVEPMPKKTINLVSKSKTTRIIYLGRVAEDNGIMDYLQAIKKLVATNNIQLDIFGDGPLLSQAKEYSQSNSLPVKFHGFVNHSNIHWQEYDIAFTSRYLSMLECSAVGLPIVAHYAADIKKDYLLDSPFAEWVAVAHSPAEIEEKYSQVLSKKWQPKLLQGQEWSGQQTWQKMAKNYSRLWKTD